MKKIFLFTTLILAACAPVITPAVTPARLPTETTPTMLRGTEAVTTSAPESGASGTPQPLPTNVRVEDDEEYYIPRMLGFDAIYPVYDPIFAGAIEAQLNDEELVMGVAIDGQAKAYPVSVLRFREMVDDELAGWPILVTW